MWWQLELPAAAEPGRDPLLLARTAAVVGAAAAVAAQAPRPRLRHRLRRRRRRAATRRAFDGRHDVERTGRRGHGGRQHDRDQLDAALARFLRITQTATTPGAPAWSMMETKLYRR